ncbi:YcxB family protein [Ruminococcus sp. 5_1_39BFAA]|uniref:YcxB family protein n=1 Tax=Ruminococcus sp. 5_1_39BFAA TaxID=457412 RepID=UPI0035648C9E
MYPATPIAENHIRITRTLFREAMHTTESKSYRKTIQKLALILLVLYAAAVWLFHMSGSVFFLLGESVFLAALLFWLFVMLPGTRMRSKYKAMTPVGSAVPERTIKFYETHLTVAANTGEETVISYKDVIGFHQTRNLYILSCQHNRCILLDKAGFVTGDFHSIETLLL